MSFKCLASQRMFQPMSRVTENEIREDVQQMAFGAGSTPVIRIFDFGAFPWSVSKRKVLTNSTCVQRELLTHGSVLQTFESKKMTKVILTRFDWIHGLIYVVSSWKTPVVSNDISKSWRWSSNNMNSEFIYVKDAWLHMLRSYFGFLCRVVFQNLWPPPFTSNCVELRVIGIYVVQRGTDLTNIMMTSGAEWCASSQMFFCISSLDDLQFAHRNLGNIWYQWV